MPDHDQNRSLTRTNAQSHSSADALTIRLIQRKDPNDNQTWEPGDNTK
jgi:hypothetical protein